MARRRTLQRVILSAAAWPLCWVPALAAGVGLPDAGWPLLVLPAAGAVLAAAAANGSRPWRTWLLGAALGNLGILLLVGAGVPAALANLVCPDYGRLTAGEGFALFVITWTVRLRMAAISASALFLLRRKRPAPPEGEPPRADAN